ncbi:hypothetical protein [Frigoriflavimonas asaccharolytica]|uniref:Putative integral membrane protein n=1 Tax=Frigoriflavimonas asaccharolytica TaxID=2735899 RepID=A0A8J8K9A3_9FLAO|nr:hypothetical protein [Frigoriflavimonas asaccharolytica]NRS92867.1 putative integral membrane protein [Frigoriflavimonas asaccharolytica]
MKTIYKVFLAIFIIFIGFNLYAIQWDLGFLNEENTTFIISLSAAILGIIVVFVLNFMSKLSLKQN